MKDFDPNMEVVQQLQGSIQEWVQTVFGYDDQLLPQKFAPAQRGLVKRNRRDLPFVVYWFPVLNLPIGIDEFITAEDGYAITGGRMGTLSMVGFGAGSGEMLQRLVLGTHPEFIPDLLSIESVSPLTDLSDLSEEGTGIEQRWSTDFNIMYRVTTDKAVIHKTFAEEIVVSLGDDVEITI